MAIKISNTTVIDDSRNLTNIAGATVTGTSTLNAVAYTSSNANVTTITSGSPNMDLSASDAFQITVTATTALTFGNAPASGKAKYVSLEIINGGAFTVTWPTNTRWPGGTAPTLTTSGTDIVVFYTDDGGSNYRAAVVQKDSK
jgi:hypothetical protein